MYLSCWPRVAAAPARQRVHLSRYMKIMAGGILHLLARRRRALRAARPHPHRRRPVLIVMNHQSLLDILTATMMGQPYVPAFVTRSRYARFIPAVSPAVRMLDGPFVDPEARPARRPGRRARGRAARALRPADLPGGAPQPDGELQPFKTRGSQAMLGARRDARVPGGHGRRLDRPPLRRLPVSTCRTCAGAPRCSGRSTPPERTERARRRDRGLRAAHGRAPRARCAGRCAPPDALREAVAGARLRRPPRPPTRAAAAAEIARLGGDRGAAVVFFGSRKTQAERRRLERATTSSWSSRALPRRSTRSLRAQGALRRGPGAGGRAQRGCRPTRSRSVTLPGGRRRCAPSARWSRRARSLRETSRARATTTSSRAGSSSRPRSRWSAATPTARRGCSTRWPAPTALTLRLGAAVAARRASTRADYCAHAAARSRCRREIRPEPEGRADALWRGAAGVPAAGLRRCCCRSCARAGRAASSPSRGATRWPGPPAGRAPARVGSTSAWSLVRATVRWAKYVVTFDDWLEFILRKARRHSGQDIQLTRARAPAARCLPVAARVPLPAAQGPPDGRQRARCARRRAGPGAALDGRRTPLAGRRRDADAAAQGLAVRAGRRQLPGALVHVGAAPARAAGRCALG